MRLVAQHYPGLSYKTLSEPWWDNFVRHAVENDAFWANYLVQKHKKMLRAKLKEHGADLIETHFGLVLDFDNEQDATMFLLRWA